MASNSQASGQMNGRTRRAVRRHGPGGILKLAANRLRSLLYLQEQHRWYELDLAGERPHKPIPEGFALVQANEQQLALLERLPTVKLDEGHKRLGDGATLWLLLEGEQPAFACWTFYGRMPVYAARSGSLELPQATAGLEDSVTSPDYRGRGLAPAAWTAVSDQLVERGYRSLITKVAEENVPSRKAVQKAGFSDIGVMRLQRIGARRKVRLETSGNGVGAELAARLGS